MAVNGAAPAFVPVNAGTLPEPEVVPKPMASAVLDQENVAPATGLVNTTDGTDAPLQYDRFATALTVGTGFTVINGVPLLPEPAHKLASVTDTREYVVFTVGETGMFAPLK